MCVRLMQKSACNNSSAVSDKPAEMQYTSQGIPKHVIITLQIYNIKGNVIDNFVNKVVGYEVF